MGSIHEKSQDTSRALLVELLVDCRFLTCTREDCPIWEQRNCLSIEKKHEYAMRLSAKEIKRVLAQYRCSYEKRLSDLNQW
jgi:hypothetical protein